MITCIAISFAYSIFLSNAQTYYNLSSGNYIQPFTSITGYPANFNGLTASSGTIPAATSITGNSTTMAASSSSSTSIQNNTNSVLFLSTGSTDNTSSVACDLNLNFAARIPGTLSFDLAQVSNSTGNRVATLRVYYSTNGTSWTELTGTELPFSATNGVAKSASISIALPAALGNQSAVKLRFYCHNGSGGSSGSRPKISLDNLQVTSTQDPTVPVITGAATASVFTTTYGASSTVQSFPVSGVNLTSDIVATAPTGFEVSSDGATYGGTTTFPQTAGSASGTLRVRLAATAAANANYNSRTISLTSIGASTVNITTPVSGNAVSPKVLTISGLSAENKNWDGSAAATVTGSPSYEGLANGETFAVTGSVSWAFADSNVGAAKTLARTGDFAAPSANYTVTQPSLTASILGVVPPAPTITEITPGNQQLSVAFTAPANNGGVPITNYEYSVNGGINWTTPSPAVSSSPLLISGLTNATTYDVQIRAVNSIGSGAASTTTQGTPEAPADATISVTPAILGGALSSTYGTASAPQNFTVAGSTLSGDLTVTAATGLEVSLSAGSGYADQLTLVSTEGTVSATPVYVRLKATAAAGAYNGVSVVVSGGGAVSQSTSTTAAGNTQATKELTVTGLSAANKEYDSTADVNVTGTAEFSGLVNGETFSPSGTVTWAFSSKTVANAKALVRTGEFAAPSANYTVTQPTLSANIMAKNLTVIGAVVATRPYTAAPSLATAATITGATLSGVIGSDVVTLTNDTTGVFAQANVGQDISVSTTMGITGTDAANYTLTQPTLTGTIVKADQTINFGELAARSIADAPFTLTATATSTLPVTFANSNESVVTLSGSTVTIVSLGTTTITASQAGDDNYNPAVAVERVLVITPVPLLWNFTGGVDTAATSPANVTVSAFSRGNNFGTTNALLTTSSASTSLLGLSGTHNAGLAARAGALNQEANGSGYFEFTVTPAAGFKSTITDFSFGSRSTSTGPQAYTIRSSADGFVADLATGTLLNDTFWALKSHSSLSVSFGAPQTFRIYGYAGVGNPSQNSTNWRVDDIRLLMTVEEKATPSITTAPTASAINEGQTLADSTLSGGLASVPGTFAFTTPTTAPAVGTSTQSVTFTPSDTVNNKSVTLDVSVTVNAPPAVDTLFTDASKNAVLSDFTGGVKRLSFGGIPGRIYGIQRSSDLTTWTQIGTVTTPQNGSATFDDPSPLAGKGFYRIVYPAADN